MSRCWCSALRKWKVEFLSRNVCVCDCSRFRWDTDDTCHRWNKFLLVRNMKDSEAREDLQIRPIKLVAYRRFSTNDHRRTRSVMNISGVVNIWFLIAAKLGRTFLETFVLQRISGELLKIDYSSMARDHRRTNYNIRAFLNYPNFNITEVKIIELKKKEASTWAFNN